jgi:antitoxin (DNA-binding transcriptional repressor) of toxin-antitoxin stability system
VATPAGSQQAALVIRDNLRHRADIEDAYLDAIESAREEIIIARNGVPLARLIPIAARRSPANAMGVSWIAPDFDSVAKQIEGLFGGGATLDGVRHGGQ